MHLQIEKNFLECLLTEFTGLFPQGSSCLCQDSDYAIISSFILKGNDVQEKTKRLYAYLCSKGHFRSVPQADILPSLIRVIEYVEHHHEPYNWRVEDKLYAENILGLYNQIKAVAELDQRQQLVLITRIISVTYGCCPTFDSKLCLLLGLNPQAKDLSVLYIKTFSKIAWLLKLFVIMSQCASITNNLPKWIDKPYYRERIEEMAHALYDGNRDEIEYQEILDNPIN